MKHLLNIILILALSLSASAENTTRKGPLRPRMHMEAKEYADTFRVAASELSPDSVVIASYDKPLRSMRETFFVTNRHKAVSLASITLRITYRRHDTGSMLHSRIVTVSLTVPPGETRQLYATSWDRQYNYYYHATRIQPRSPRAVAYDVELTPLSALFER